MVTPQLGIEDKRFLLLIILCMSYIVISLWEIIHFEIIQHWSRCNRRRRRMMADFYRIFWCGLKRIRFGLLQLRSLCLIGRAGWKDISGWKGALLTIDGWCWLKLHKVYWWDFWGRLRSNAAKGEKKVKLDWLFSFSLWVQLMGIQLWFLLHLRTICNKIWCPIN